MKIKPALTIAVLATALFLGLPLASVLAQQTVFSRSENTSGLWWDDNPANLPWFYATSSTSQNRPDNPVNTANFVKIGHNNNTTMTVNGTFFWLGSLEIQGSASSARTYNSSSGGGWSFRTSGEGFTNNSTANQTINVPVGIDAGTVVFRGNNTATNTFTATNYLNANTADYGGTAAGSHFIVSGVVTGTGGSIIKSGANTLTLSGSNDYTGTTSVNEGTLRVNNASALGATNSGTTVASGATVVFVGPNTNIAEAFTISGSGVGGQGALRNQSGVATTNTGLITLAAASRIQNDANATHSILGGITNTGNFTLTLAATDSGSSGQIIVTNVGIGLGSGGLIKEGAGQVILGMSNDYTGLTTVSAGVLSVNQANALGSTANGTVVASGAQLRLNGPVTVSGEALTISGTGPGGTGALARGSGSPNYGGPITLSNDASIASAGTFTISGSITNVNTADSLIATNASGGRTIFSGNLNLRTGGVTKEGAGTITLQGTNSYTGNTAINAGTVELSGGNAIADTAAVVLADVAGVGLVLTNGNETIGSLRGGGASGGLVSIAPTRTLTVAETGSQTFAGVISNTGNLVKSGAGTTTLTGANVFSGTTTVTNGVLALNRTGGGALGSTTSVGVGTGATLLVSQSGQVNDSASVTLSGGTIAKGSGAVNETFGALTLNATSYADFGSGTGNFTFASYTPGSFKLTLQNFNVGNSLTVTTGTFAAGQFDFGSFGYSWDTVPSGGFTITAIPEPSTVLAAVGLAGLLLWPLRRRWPAALKA